jgi:DNA-binding IclR family transcriptional regulator
VSLTEIAGALEIAPSSAHAILGVLVEQAAVTIDTEKRYRLGPAIFYLGASFARNSPLYRSIWNEVVRVAREFDLACAIAIPWEQHFLILAVHQNGGPHVGVPIGSRMPIFAGSYGKTYTAWSGVEPKTLTRYTAESITDLGHFRTAVQETKRLGYATDHAEFVESIGAVASGVTSDSGFVGLAALMGSMEHLDKIGFGPPGDRLASLANWASVILGDSSREKVWGEVH